MTREPFPCRTDPDRWFSTKAADERYCKEQCRQCPIMADCAETAMRDGIPCGVWGGLTEEERAKAWKLQGGRPTIFANLITETIGALQNGGHESRRANAAAAAAALDEQLGIGWTA